MSNEKQAQNGQCSKVAINVDAMLDDARQQLLDTENRRKELRRVIRNLTGLKQRQLPSELFKNQQH